jgi:hypothetical protein
MHTGGEEVQLHSLLSSALDGGEQLTSRPDRCALQIQSTLIIWNWRENKNRKIKICIFCTRNDSGLGPNTVFMTPNFVFPGIQSNNQDI